MRRRSFGPNSCLPWHIICGWWAGSYALGERDGRVISVIEREVETWTEELTQKKNVTDKVKYTRKSKSLVTARNR